MRLLSILTASVVSFSVASAQAADGVGKAMGVIDAASASGQVGDRTLAIGSEIFIGDLVATDAGGEAQLLFSDGTRMVVGSNSSLVIDQFVFRGKAAENKFAVRALGGAFRFISGDSGDAGYSIKTPTATIGVRGTAFDFTVTPGEGTKLVLLEGETIMCGEDEEQGENGNCVAVATPCAVLSGASDEEVKEIDEGRQEEIRDNFPYVTSDEELLAPFQVTGHGCGKGGLATQALNSSSIPAEAVIIGTLVVVGGVVIGILLGDKDSNNNTNK